jgi:hypothetical protein
METFEENTRIAIGKLKKLIGNDSFSLDGLNTTTKSSLIDAINEVKETGTPQEIFTRDYGISPNHVTIQYVKDKFDNEIILYSVIT